MSPTTSPDKPSPYNFESPKNNLVNIKESEKQQRLVKNSLKKEDPVKQSSTSDEMLIQIKISKKIEKSPQKDMPLFTISRNVKEITKI